ncbi:hypothetical protein BC628DRAFT_1396857 [Trametes gibbosa]|nr:hypothetical protein BC628DRAFT_1396857 [Trametes gibbosa]
MLYPVKRWAPPLVTGNVKRPYTAQSRLRAPLRSNGSLTAYISHPDVQHVRPLPSLPLPHDHRQSPPRADIWHRYATLYLSEPPSLTDGADNHDMTVSALYTSFVPRTKFITLLDFLPP